MGLVICEFDYQFPDPDRPEIALAELDFYAWIPKQKDTPNHRLSLRKSLVKEIWELYRFIWTEAKTVASSTFFMATTGIEGYEEVIFSSKDLQECLSFANGECLKFHGERELDKVCTHKYPNARDNCKEISYDEYFEEKRVKKS